MASEFHSVLDILHASSLPDQNTRDRYTSIYDSRLFEILMPRIREYVYNLVGIHVGILGHLGAPVI